MARNNSFNQQSYKRHEGYFYDYIHDGNKGDHAKTWPSPITEDSLRAQMKVLCENCGWFKKRGHQEILSTDKMSPAWEKTLSDYKKNKPQLTPYEVVRPSRKENEEA